MRMLIALLALSACVVPASAQDLGRVALVQALKEAACPLRLMCVAAHPDDEDGATLAYYRMKYGAQTCAVIATRGEGGQNEIGPELYGELGAIRTKEMMNAARVEGSDLFFLNLPEFGFSKSAEEAFEKWGHDEALKRMEAVLAKWQPQVVITHHGLMKDHGQHQAIGQVIKEAVERARPGAGFSPPKSLYVRRFEGGSDTIKIDLGELEPVRGLTYAQVAAHALEEHKSQGMKFFIDRYLTGRPEADYMLRVGDRTMDPASSILPLTAMEFGPLFEGVTAGRDYLGFSTLAQQAANGLPNEEICKALAVAWPKVIPEAQNEFGPIPKAGAIAAEVRLKATPGDSTVIRGQKVTIKLEVTDFGAADIDTATVKLLGQGGGFESLREEKPITLAGGAAAAFELTVPDKAALTVPSSEHFNEDTLYVPQVRAAVTGTLKCGAPFTAMQDLYFDVAPPIVMSFEGGPYFLNATRNARSADVRIKLKSYTPGPAHADVSLQVPQGWHATPPMLSAQFTGEDQEQVVSASVLAVETFDGSASIKAFSGDTPHLAEANVVAAAVALPKEARVGLIRSYDDTLENTLRKLGLAYGLIGAEDFAPESLKQYTAIVVDMRAYQYRRDLVANNQAIFDYIHAGGKVLVLYHKTFDWKPEYAPIPFQIANNRVTREDAAMKLLVPEHAFFTTPNTLAASDWGGWIQERGLYFAGEWPKDYTPLLECQDPGENVPPGALITAKYGDGQYTYCALALYRQLRELNPGALRLFVNLTGG